MTTLRTGWCGWGRTTGGVELQVVALDLPDYVLVIHVMPTQLRRRHP